MTCPDSHDIAHHERVKADAMSGAPTTEDGKYLLRTRREWPGLGWCAECSCRSTLLIVTECEP